MTDVFIEKVNDVYCRVVAERYVLQELAETFTFEVPGAKFSPKYKAGMWDGKISMINNRNGQAYFGLFKAIARRCAQLDYEVEIDASFKPEVEPSNERSPCVDEAGATIQ